MRKKIFSGVFALALLATAGWGVNKSMSNDAGLSDLALANVEALADSETSEEFTAATNCIACHKDHNCTGKDGKNYSFAHHKDDPSHP